METDNINIKTYRYKFTDGFSSKMQKFSKIHAYDDIETFKDAFNEWTKTNNECIMNEEKRLQNIGYAGNIEQKIFNSVRYYYRKKSNKQSNKKQRRNYISINKDLLDHMDGHISQSYRKVNIKPSDAYDNFCKTFKKEITNECTFITKHTALSNEDAANKIKKTYKNRYFIFKKSYE